METAASNYRDGKVIVQDNTVKVEDPELGGKFATIRPGRNLILTLNGEYVTTRQIVTSADRIQLEITNSEPKLEYKLMISRDKMEAKLEIHREIGIKHRLQAIETNNGTIIEAVPSTVEPNQLSYEEIMAALKQEGIIFGINEENIGQALHVPIGVNLWIAAEGLPPKPGEDAWIEYTCFVVDQNLDDIASIDWAKHSVEIGQTLALKHPIGSLGEKGINIFGDLLEPPLPKDIAIRHGSGVELKNSGSLAVATIDGRAVLQNNVLIVYPVLEIKGDVETKSRAIKFRGDIVVNGDVLDGTTIEALGKVLIKGSVNHADINSGGDISIQGKVISSFVRAGATQVGLEKATESLGKLVKDIEFLIKAVQQLKNNIIGPQDNRMDGIMVKAVLNNKFNHVPSFIKTIINELTQLSKVFEIGAIPQILNEVKKLDAILQKPTMIENLGQIEKLIFQLIEPGVELNNLLQTIESNFASISLAYAQTSILQATGNVILYGQGCYMSNIQAGKDVKLTGRSGVFLGGEIQAPGIIQARQLGNHVEVATKIVVSKKSNVRAQKIYPGVKIVVASL